MFLGHSDLFWLIPNRYGSLPMIDLLSNFDAFTMAVLVAALYFSLSSVLVYTYLYRRTYPGFGEYDARAGLLVCRAVS